jgi:integrase
MESPKTFNFTKARIEELPVPSAGRATYSDVGVDGLALIVYPSGTKTFHLIKKLKRSNKTIKPKLGKFGEIDVDTARKLAMKMLSEIAQGSDPDESYRALKGEVTLGELFDLYIKEYARHHCATWKDMVANFNRYYGIWRDKKVSTIKKADIQSRVNELGRERGQHTANRSLDDLRAALGWGRKYGYVKGENAASEIAKFKTQSRERFLKPEEMSKFFQALKKEENISFRDYVYLSLFTGARQANVLAMRWDEIDFDLGTWRIPKTKTGKSQIVPLTSQALDVLVERRESTKSDWVFPSKSASGHVVEPKNGWRSLLKRTGLSDLRMHDLRRTLGSYMAMNNQSLHMIGRVLGHSSAASTQIYSRFANDPVRQAMESTQSQMMAMAGLLPAKAKPKPKPKAKGKGKSKPSTSPLKRVK